MTSFIARRRLKSKKIAFNFTICKTIFLLLLDSLNRSHAHAWWRPNKIHSRHNNRQPKLNCKSATDEIGAETSQHFDNLYTFKVSSPFFYFPKCIRIDCPHYFFLFSLNLLSEFVKLSSLKYLSNSAYLMKFQRRKKMRNCAKTIKI